MFDEDKPYAVICDIDNTVLDITHRYHFLNGKDTDWKQFLDKENIKQDKPIWDTVNVVSCLGTRYPIIFITGRNEGTREQTETQLADLFRCTPLLHRYELYMRKDGDTGRSDAEVKRELYEKYVQPRYNILVALDDKPSIVDLWRSLGITTYHVGELASGDGF